MKRLQSYSRFRKTSVRGWHIVENKMIHTDSLMELHIIEELVKNGFSHKWRRLQSGLALGAVRYTPDVELSVQDGEYANRALVEFKAFSPSEFKMDRRRKLLAVAHFYKHAIPMLYVHETKQWYVIGDDGKVIKTSPPQPGFLNINQLQTPKIRIPVFGPYGRIYLKTPGNLILGKTADGLEFGIKAIFGPSKKRRSNRHRR